MAQTIAHKQATQRYESKAYDKILLRIRRDADLTRKDIQTAADAKNESLNQYILNSIKQRIQEEKK